MYYIDYSTLSTVHVMEDYKKIKFMNPGRFVNLAKSTIFINRLCQINDFPRFVNIASQYCKCSWTCPALSQTCTRTRYSCRSGKWFSNELASGKGPPVRAKFKRHAILVEITLIWLPEFIRPGCFHQNADA